MILKLGTSRGMKATVYINDDPGVKSNLVAYALIWGKSSQFNGNIAIKDLCVKKF